MAWKLRDDAFYMGYEQAVTCSRVREGWFTTLLEDYNLTRGQVVSLLLLMVK